MSSSLVEFSNDLANAVERAGASVISVLEGGRDGVSGTVWRDGVAITAEHTIRRYNDVTVVLPSGERTKATVSGRDPSTDIAILKLAHSPQPVRVADESQVRVGEVVLSVARRGEEGLATSHGVVSALGGAWRTSLGGRIDRWVRLDISAFPGFSGGAVINARGEGLGMATSGERRAFALIPAATVNRVVDQLLKRGRIARGFLGVGVQPVMLPEGVVGSLKLKTDRGLLVSTIAPGSAAEAGGILFGDIIVGVEGAPVRGMRSLQSALDAENVGKTITLDLVRGAQLQQKKVTVAEKQEA